MVIWFGEEDSRRRMIKINWLKTHFVQTQILPIHSLTADSLKDNRSVLAKLIGTKEKLIISGHGNDQSFMGLTAKNLFDDLRAKGLNHDRFNEIYLLACNIGQAEQDNSIHSNFLRDFGRLTQMNEATKNIKVYGPRGLILWTFSEEIQLGEKFEKVTDVKIIKSVANLPNQESYSFSAGLMLYNM